jgi:hypothetical protein
VSNDTASTLTILGNATGIVYEHHFTVGEDILPDEDYVWACSPRLMAWLAERGIRAKWYCNGTLGVGR